MYRWIIKQINNYLILIILQITFIIVISLAAFGIDIPVVRQIIGFIYLTFIPGHLILRALRIRDIPLANALLYSVGLSLAFIMVVGFVANLALPPLGITNPISFLPITISIIFTVSILGVIVVIKEREAKVITWDIKKARQYLLPALILLLIILLCAFSALLLAVFINIKLTLIMMLIPQLVEQWMV